MHTKIPTKFANGGFDWWQGDVNGIEGGVDVWLSRRRAGRPVSGRIRNEFDDESAAGRILEPAQLLVSVLSPAFRGEGCLESPRRRRVAPMEGGAGVVQEARVRIPFLSSRFSW